MYHCIVSMFSVAVVCLAERGVYPVLGRERPTTYMVMVRLQSYMVMVRCHNLYGDGEVTELYGDGEVPQLIW